MHPILIHLGPLTLTAYGAAMSLAFLVAVGLARHDTRHRLRGHAPLSEAEVADWAIWAVVGGIVGGRFFYVVLNWETYALAPGEIVAVWHGGLIWYGGFLGGVAGTALYLRRRGAVFLRGADQVIPFIAIGHAIGRLGCFANGCCAGKPTSAWFGVVFPGETQPVAPTQLFEAAGLLILFVLLRYLQTPSNLRRPGTVLGAYLIGYGLLRWGVEWWRANQPLVWHGWTLSQLISVALALLGAGLVVSGRLCSTDATPHASRR